MGKTVYLAKNIITMAQETKPDAVFSVNGRIVSVGKRSDILAQTGTDAEVVDFGGATILPGFIDAHSHICACANKLALLDLTEARSFDDIIAAGQAYKKARAIKTGQWIVGFGYDNNFLSERTHPTKEILDKISGENPIVITHVSGHMGVLNSVACGLTGAQGDGYMEEAEFMQISAKIPAPGKNEMEKLMELAQKEYLQYGITTAQEGVVKEREAQILKDARLCIDVVGYVDLERAKPVYDTCGQYKTAYQDHLRFSGYKIFLDGSPQGRTAWMSRPYEGEKTYTGSGNYQDSEVTDFFITALRENVQILVHCNGDAACEQFIRCLQAAHARTGLPILNRPVMIHAQFVTKEQLRALKKLNCVVSFFNAHTYYWGDIHKENFGRRAQRISPLHTAQKIGLCYTLHQDSPVIKPDMLFSVWCARTRRTQNGQILGPKERLGIYDALRAVTVNGAYQYFEEYDKGTIEPGKLCDLVLLSENPLETAVEKIRDIRVLATVKAGKTVYEATGK